jgi:uncharacterized protein YukE
MATLNTQVDGDTGSVRATADGISALGGGLDDAGAGFAAAASQSESQWSGNAGDAFRGKITSAQQATRLAATATHQVRDATHAFAAQMDQVKAKMKQAESLASGAGLSVSGNSIEPPKPPAAPANACYTKAAATQVAAAFHAEVAKYQRQMTAFKKAEQLIKQARQQETQAHTALRQANKDAENLLSELKNDKYWIAGDTALSTAERGLTQAENWAKKADHYTTRFNNLIDNLETLPEGSEARLAQLRAASRAMDDLVNANESEDINKVLALGLDSKYAKFLSRLGYVTSAAEILKDVLNPKDRARNLAGDATSAGIGAGASELIGELSLDSAVETGGLSLLAGGLAVGGGYAVKQYGPTVWKWANRQLGNFEHDLVHTFDPMSYL